MFSEVYSSSNTQYLFSSQQSFLETRQAKFRTSLGIRQDKLELLAESIFPLIDKGRTRKRQARWRDKEEKTLGCIIANAAMADVDGTACFYSRDKSLYTSGSPYGPEWLTSTTLCATTKLMGERGLLDHVIAAQGIDVAHQSTFASTEELRATLADHAIGPDCIVTDRDANSPIVLKYTTGLLARFDINDPAVRQMAMIVNMYNDFQSGFSYSYTPMTSRVYSTTGRLVYRVFNNYSFAQGGRFYGGWWLLLYKDERHSIIINGEPTIELDFSSMFPRMLYNVCKVNYRDQAYNLPLVMQMAADQDIDFVTEVKPGLKMLMNMAINAQEPYRLHDAPFCGIAGLTYEDADHLLWQQHEPLIPFRHSGAGMYLMKLEALIAEHVLYHAVMSDIPILPIHDSFRVQARHEGWLRNQMMESYRFYMGYDPVI